MLRLQLAVLWLSARSAYLIALTRVVSVAIINCTPSTKAAGPVWRQHTN